MQGMRTPGAAARPARLYFAFRGSPPDSAVRRHPAQTHRAASLTPAPLARKPSLPAAASRPLPGNKPAAKLLYVVAATVAVAVYAAAVLTLREAMKTPLAEN